MSKETLKKWLNGEYVSPQEFKDSVQEAVKRIGILEKIYKADVEYYMKEIERIKEEHAQDCFKLIELQTAIKIKDQTIQNVTSRLHETRNEIQTILDSPLTDFSELHEAIQDILNKQ